MQDSIEFDEQLQMTFPQGTKFHLEPKPNSNFQTSHTNETYQLLPLTDQQVAQYILLRPTDPSKHPVPPTLYLPVPTSLEGAKEAIEIAYDMNSNTSHYSAADALGASGRVESFLDPTNSKRGQEEIVVAKALRILASTITLY